MSQRVKYELNHDVRRQSEDLCKNHCCCCNWREETSCIWVWIYPRNSYWASFTLLFDTCISLVQNHVASGHLVIDTRLYINEAWNLTPSELERATTVDGAGDRSDHSWSGAGHGRVRCTFLWECVLPIDVMICAISWQSPWTSFVWISNWLDVVEVILRGEGIIL